MRKARRVTRADYHAAGRGFARDINEGLAAIERRKLAHSASSEPDYPGAPIRQQRLYLGHCACQTYCGVPGCAGPAEDVGDVRIMDYGKDSKARYRVASFCPGYETGGPGDTPKMNPERDEWCVTLHEANQFFSIYVASAVLDGWTTVSPTGRLT